jgi:hypothetical protein
MVQVSLAAPQNGQVNWTLFDVAEVPETAEKEVEAL